MTTNKLTITTQKLDKNYYLPLTLAALTLYNNGTLSFLIDVVEYWASEADYTIFPALVELVWDVVLLCLFTPVKKVAMAYFVYLSVIMPVAFGILWWVRRKHAQWFMACEPTLEHAPLPNVVYGHRPSRRFVSISNDPANSSPGANGVKSIRRKPSAPGSLSEVTGSMKRVWRRLNLMPQAEQLARKAKLPWYRRSQPVLGSSLAPTQHHELDDSGTVNVASKIFFRKGSPAMTRSKKEDEVMMLSLAASNRVKSHLSSIVGFSSFLPNLSPPPNPLSIPEIETFSPAHSSNPPPPPPKKLANGARKTVRRRSRSRST